MSLLGFTFLIKCRIWSFHVVVLQMTAKKCTKMYNARAEPLYCSLNRSICRCRRRLLKLPNKKTTAQWRRGLFSKTTKYSVCK